jgi:DNA repair protein RAD50
LQARLQQLDGGEIDNLHNEMTQIVDKRREITNIQNRMEQCILEKDMTLRNIKELSNSIDILNQSDEELSTMNSQLSQFIHDQENQKLKFENEKRRLQQEVSNCQKELSEQFSLKGQYQAEEQAQERRKMDSQLFSIELIHKHKISGFNATQFMDSDLPKLIEKLEHESARQDSEVKAYRVSAKDKENQVLDQLQNLKGRLSSYEESKRFRQSQISSLRAKVTEYQKKCTQLATAQHEVENLQETIAFEEVELSEFQTKIQKSDKSTLKQELDNKIQELEQKQQELRSEASMLSFQGDTRAKFAVKRSEKQKKMDQYNRLVNSIQSECSSILGGSFKIETLENDLNHVLRSKESALKQMQDTYLSKSNRLSALESRISLVDKSIQQKSDELNSKLGAIKKVCGDIEYPKALEKAEKDLELYRTNVSSMRSASTMYEKFIGKFKETKCCPLCVRNFSDMQQETAFLTKLETVLARVPQATQVAESEYQKAEEIMKKLRDLQSFWDDCDRLSNVELPELREQKENYDAEHLTLATNAEDAETEQATIQVEMDQIRSLQQRSAESIRIYREIEQLEREISSLNSDLSASGTSRTLEENQLEMDSVEKELKTTRSKRELAVKEQQSMQASVQTRQTRINDLKNNLREAEFQVKEYGKLQLQIQDHQDQIVGLNQSQTEADTEITDIPRQIQTLEQKLTIQRREFGVREEALLKDLQEFSNSYSRLISLHQDIKRYTESGMATRIQDCARQIDTKEKLITSLKHELDVVMSSLEGFSKKESEIQLKQRNISDNIQLRKYKADVTELESRITTLKRKVDASNHSSIDDEYNRLKDRHDLLLGERSQIVGEIKQLEEQVRKLQLQLTTDYRDIDKKYLDLKYKVTSTELSCEDLEKYSVSLDRAIMKFHAMKMNEINKIIRELWIKTYRGTDIDTIEIRSDPDGGDNTKKNYNYRVVMVRRDVEMDMRGRCSAGQKVLASIIIRLALAETFCLNCGILALDEPTTNLDSENIASLARSLGEYCQLNIALSKRGRTKETSN